jgi:hypothetical protein
LELATYPISLNAVKSIMRDVVAHSSPTPPLKKVNVSGLFADQEQEGLVRNFSLIRPLADREPATILGKRTSSIVSKDWNPMPLKTPKKLESLIGLEKQVSFRGPLTANFNDMDFGHQFSLFEQNMEPKIEEKVVEELPLEPEE